MKKTFYPTFIAFASLALFPLSDAIAGPREDIIRLTHNLEESTVSLKGEFQSHYRGTQQYQALIGCIRSLEGRAKHIHGLSHESVNSARELRRDVKSMDETVHRIHDYLDRVERGGRRTSGNTSHVHNELKKMTRTLHSLDKLATIRIQRQNERLASRPPIPNPLTYNSAPLHPHYGSGNRNLGNLVFPNQSRLYSQPGYGSNTYGNRGYGNSGVTTSNQFGNRQSGSSRYSQSSPNRYGSNSQSSGGNRSHGSSRNQGSNRNSGSSSRSSGYNQQPSYSNDPARQFLESLFRGFQPR